jgi:L,D-transpeptidase catalytic domain
MPRTVARIVALSAAPALAVSAVLVFAPSAHSPVARLRLAPPARPAWTAVRPVPLPVMRQASRWAPVIRTVLVRVAPGPTAAPLTTVATRTPEGTTNILELLGTARREPSGLWQRARLAVLPNGRTGWVPRSALGGSVFLDARLVVDRQRFRATLFRDSVPVFTAAIGIGQPQWPTPAGDFYVRDVLTRYRSPFYGPVAFGTSARSPTLTDWPGGGYIGIHGTDQPSLIPGAISHGCIRMRNADILRLAALMPVGTPITIR